MEESLKTIKLKDKLNNLPLFFRTIYYNQLTSVEDEKKLFKYSSKTMNNYMRHYSSSRKICKTFDNKIFEQKK